MEISIQVLLTLLTIISTLITLHIRVCNNFFMFILKRNYKEVPGEQSIFEMILNLITYIGIIIYFVVMICLIIVNFFTRKIPSSEDKSYSIISAIVAIIISAFYSCYKIIQRFGELQIQFRSKLEGKVIEFAEDYHRKNKLNIIVVAIQLVICLISIVAIVFTNTKINNNSIIIFQEQSSLPVMFFCIILAFIMLTIMLIAITMSEVIKTLESDNTYILVTDKEILCTCYLEYTNYYLVIKNNIEYYIKKNKVDMIKKYSGLI